MSSKPQPPLFLEQGNYRQRRLRDVALALPIMGGVLCLLPLIWPQDGDDAVTTGNAALYIFGVWLVLIGLTAIVAHRIKLTKDELDDTQGPD